MLRGIHAEFFYKAVDDRKSRRFEYPGMRLSVIARYGEIAACREPWKQGDACDGDV
jgi:hypothetical protein